VSAVHEQMHVHGTDWTELRLVSSYVMRSVRTMNMSGQHHEHIFFEKSHK
jgi:hypothetical protein